MRRFALWLCDPATTSTSITQVGLQPPVLASIIEANWIWDFLQKTDSGNPLLNRARMLASLSIPKKNALNAWVNSVSTLSAQFQPAPLPWPIGKPAIGDPAWVAFKELMEAFYEKAFKSTRGLPYLPDGTPTITKGLTYGDFVQAFRDAHRLNPNFNAREVCVLCGGNLGQTPEVDHWMYKAAYPLLSVCSHNLLPACGECNSTTNKGKKSVHTAGNFAEWFHPYLRPGYGNLRPTYVLQNMSVTCTATQIANQAKADNVDQLLNLANRWTKEFKAEYGNQQGVLRRREQNRLKQNQTRYARADIQTYVQEWQQDLVPSEPHHEVHQALAAALLEPSRLEAWYSELQLETYP